MRQILADYIMPIPDRVGPYVAMLIRHSPIHNKPMLYVMRSLEARDGYGYIFKRYSDEQWGHTGKHPRRDDCVWRAIQLETTAEVYEFSSAEERDNWLHKTWHELNP